MFLIKDNFLISLSSSMMLSSLHFKYWRTLLFKAIKWFRKMSLNSIYLTSHKIFPLNTLINTTMVYPDVITSMIFTIPPGVPYSSLQKMFMMFEFELWMVIKITFSIQSQFKSETFCRRWCRTSFMVVISKLPR